MTDVWIEPAELELSHKPDDPCVASERASEPRERNAPTVKKDLALARRSLGEGERGVGESEGRSPSD
jgi:hypothetical protein